VHGETLQVQSGGQLARVQSLPPLERWETLSSDAHRHKEAKSAGIRNPSSFLRSDYESVITQGAAFEPGQVVAIEGGRLLSLSLGATLQLSQADVPVHPSSTCTALEGTKTSTALLFVCQGKQSEVFTLTIPKQATSDAASIVKADPLRRLIRWKHPRKLLGRAPGRALFSGSCKADATGAAWPPSKLCLLRSDQQVPLEDQKTQKLLKKALRPGVSHAFSLGLRDAWLLWLDPQDAILRAARLWSKEATTEASARTWKLPEGSSLREFLQEGSILPHATRTPEFFSLWLIDRDQFTGVHLGDDERPSFSAIQRPTSRALFDGPRVLLWGAAGFGKISEDHGQSFHEIALPYQSGDGAPSYVESSTQAVTMGCSSVGCI